MNELQRMIDAADAATEPVYLATVVDVDGSAYRRQGARMLVLPGAEHIGSISGGCLERDLCRSAPWLTREGPRVVSFDTRMDADDPNPRYNLGCSGVIHVLVERVTGDARCPLRVIRRVLKDDRAALVATVYDVEGNPFPAIGTRILDFDTSGHDRGVRKHAARVRDTGRPLGCELLAGDAHCRLLIERIDPPRELLIFGAGDDAQPLSTMANELGWRVIVIDKRPEMLTATRFPAAHRRVIAHPSEAARHVAPNARTAAVLMTHSFGDDIDLLPWLLASGAGSVGLLGPKSRTAKLMRRLHERGELPPAEQLERLRSPIGLDLGASTPATIAVSILADIVALDNDRPGGRLRERRGPIHAPAAHFVVELSDTRALRDAAEMVH